MKCSLEQSMFIWKSNSIAVEQYLQTMKVFILLSVLAVALAKECGENQHYDSCGTACPLTCDNYQDPPVACVLMCNPGCHCDKGYVKTNDGRCVKPETCPLENKPVCGDNERYTTCGKACALTCDNYQNPPKICPLMCIIGCECKSGFVKTRDGQCVRPEECPSDAPVEKSCTGKPDPGMCQAYMPSWYYDAESGKCQKFVYGGCQGNGNRYRTESECLQHCSAVQKSCSEKPDPGMCQALMPRWYYDAQSGKCQKFVYGGCQGNGNRYLTEDECLEQCSGDLLQVPANEVCSLPAVTGPCRAAFKRFYFNGATGDCEEFTYGGCNGNENNFKTKEGCRKMCA